MRKRFHAIKASATQQGISDRNHAPGAMSLIAQLRDDESRGFVMLPIDKSIPIAVIDTDAVRQQYEFQRDQAVQDKKLRRSFQAEETIVEQVADDLLQLVNRSPWSDVLAAGAASWRLWKYFRKYIDAHADRMEVPQSRLFWKEKDGTVRMVVDTQRSTICAGVGKAIVAVAQEWMQKIRDETKREWFPLFRCVQTQS